MKKFQNKRDNKREKKKKKLIKWPGGGWTAQGDKREREKERIALHTISKYIICTTHKEIERFGRGGIQPVIFTDVWYYGKRERKSSAMIYKQK